MDWRVVDKEYLTISSLDCSKGDYILHIILYTSNILGRQLNFPINYYYVTSYNGGTQQNNTLYYILRL